MQHIHIKVTPETKALLEWAASQETQSLSDYLRLLGVQRARAIAKELGGATEDTLDSYITQHNIKSQG